MSIDQSGNKRVMLPSVIGHFNKTLKGNLDRDKVFEFILLKKFFLRLEILLGKNLLLLDRLL